MCVCWMANWGDCRPTSKAADEKSFATLDVVACSAGAEELACGPDTTCSVGPLKMGYDGKEVDVMFCEQLYTLKVCVKV